jgi:hypothetical protein
VAAKVLHLFQSPNVLEVFFEKSFSTVYCRFHHFVDFVV